MTDAVYIEMPTEIRKNKFWRNWRVIVLGLIILGIILAGLFSWWLARGKVSSASARLDTLVYTVEPEFSTRLENIFVRLDEVVKAGQPLANINVSTFGSHMRDASLDITSMRQLPGMEEIHGRLADARLAEKDMSARLAQARSEEEKFRKIYQERVTEHVRAQLAMRSLDRGNRAGYDQAANAENAARARMDASRDDFEQASKMRAAMDLELNRIRSEILRARQRSSYGSSSAKNSDPQSFVFDPNLYAPVAGRILKINAAPGQMLQAREPVFLILPAGNGASSDIWIQAWFPLDARQKIKVGQKVNVRFEDKGLHLIGRVAAIDDELQALPDAANGLVPVAVNSVNAADAEKYNPSSYLPVRITLDDPGQAATLAPGAKADCQIQTRYLLGENLF